jgi:hypothetical protein
MGARTYYKRRVIPNKKEREVMQWEALLKNGKKRCANTSTKN